MFVYEFYKLYSFLPMVFTCKVFRSILEDFICLIRSRLIDPERNRSYPKLPFLYSLFGPETSTRRVPSRDRHEE